MCQPVPVENITSSNVCFVLLAKQKKLNFKHRVLFFENPCYRNKKQSRAFFPLLFLAPVFAVLSGLEKLDKGTIDREQFRNLIISLCYCLLILVASFSRSFFCTRPIKGSPARTGSDTYLIFYRIKRFV